MTETYLSTFISGFDALVEKQLPRVISDVQITEIFDGLVVFESSQFDAISNLRFINNSFTMLTSCKTLPSNDPEVIVRKLLTEIKRAQFPTFLKKHKTFKVFVSKENQTISISKSAKEEVVDNLRERTKLKHEPLLADLEFWFIMRSEGIAYFAVRIPSDKKKNRDEGELASELAHFLSLISEPKKTDTAFDPFAGSGAIIRERTTAFPYKHAIASDLKTSDNLKKMFEKDNQIEVRNYNALFLGKMHKHSIDKIITDPPWGMYEENKTDYFDFYARMLKEFDWTLKPNGIAVILTARKEEFISALKSIKSFKLVEEYNILVSGKKAGVYKLMKNSPL